MTPRQTAIAALLSLTVAGLMSWQILRERRLAACIAAGHDWHGATSTCRPAKFAPILQRGELGRS